MLKEAERLVAETKLEQSSRTEFMDVLNGFFKHVCQTLAYI
jgi:hypothetical protein